MKRKDWKTIIEKFLSGKRKLRRFTFVNSNVASVTRCRLIRTYGFENIRQVKNVLVFTKS